MTLFRSSLYVILTNAKVVVAKMEMRENFSSLAKDMVRLAIGEQNFDRLLGGAALIDRHALETPLADNLAARQALFDDLNAPETIAV